MDNQLKSSRYSHVNIDGYTLGQIGILFTFVSFISASTWEMTTTAMPVNKCIFYCLYLRH